MIPKIFWKERSQINDFLFYLKGKLNPKQKNKKMLKEQSQSNEITEKQKRKINEFKTGFFEIHKIYQSLSRLEYGYKKEESNYN